MRLNRFRAWWKRHGIDPDAKLLADVESATAAGIEVRQFVTDLEMEGNDVALSPVGFELFGGKYQGSLNARLGTTMTGTLRSRITDIDVAQLSAFGGVPDAVTGRLTGAGTFSGQGADLAGILASARGEGTAQIVNGTIEQRVGRDPDDFDGGAIVTEEHGSAERGGTGKQFAGKRGVDHRNRGAAAPIEWRQVAAGDGFET